VFSLVSETEKNCLHLVCYAAISLLWFSWVLFSVSVCFYALFSNITQHVVKWK